MICRFNDVLTISRFNDDLMISRLNDMSSVSFNDIRVIYPDIFRPPTSIPEYSDSVSDVGPVGQASLFRSNHPDRFPVPD
jgi:hypothetical protein